VVNGLLADGPGAEVPALGLLPLGSGCDYVRTFDIPSDVAVAARLIASEALTEVDVGEVACEGSANRFFVNIAEAGFGATVVARAARLPRALGPAMYLAAFWIELPRFPRPTVGVNAPGEDAFDGRAMNIVIAIGRAFGGGMKVAPSADPSDGLFDVQVHHGSKLDYVRGIPKVFRGTHVPHPRVQEWRVSCVEVTAHPELLIEADGEVLGRTPATFTIIPRALRLRCGP
jgi:diacylglycerol kinase family enzyme